MNIEKENKSIAVAELLDTAIGVYQNTDNSYLESLPKTSFLKKLWHEYQLLKIVKQLKKDIEPYKVKLQNNDYKSEEHKKQLTNEAEEIINQYMREIDKKKLLFDQTFISFFLEYDYLDLTEHFISKSKEKDSQLESEEIIQALSNILVMYSFQIFWDIPLQLTPSMYSYSMLYPYTDNYLDSNDISNEDKLEFNNRLTKMIHFQRVAPKNRTEERIISLLNNIESEYSKDLYPEIFESIDWIHKAQIKDVELNNTGPIPYDEVLKFNFFKGGTSVLADGYLVNGKLNEEERNFLFQSGTYLQLIDDLLDIESDRSENKKTVFTIDNELKDEEVNKLLSYIYRVNQVKKTDTSIQKKVKNMIFLSTFMLIMSILGENPDFISKEFYKKIESHSKIRMKSYAIIFEQIDDLLNP